MLARLPAPTKQSKRSAFLQTHFPHLQQLAELRPDPHLLGWIRGLGQEDPPLSHYSRRIYLTCLRRLLRDLAPEGQRALILPEDFPPSYNLKTVRAYLLKEDFQQFWTYNSPHWAGLFLDFWCAQTMRSRIEPMNGNADLDRAVKAGWRRNAA